MLLHLGGRGKGDPQSYSAQDSPVATKTFLAPGICGLRNRVRRKNIVDPVLQFYSALFAIIQLVNSSCN